MKKSYIFLWGLLGAMVFAGIVVLMLKAGKTDNGNPSARYGQPKTVNASEDWVRGDINAKVTLVEYADFQCPACAIYYPVLKQLEEKFGSQIAFVYRYFPLTQIHQNAELSAISAEAAGKQGKFWEMHDKLFENQTTWATAAKARDIFIGYAKDLGLDENKFKDGLDSKEIRDKIYAEYNEGSSIGVNSTPTFFMNGKMIPSPRSYEEFEKVISDKLAP